MIMMYNENATFSNILHNNSLTDINNAISDQEVANDIWASYGARLHLG